MSCALCGGEMTPVIYYGLPFRLCRDTSCSCLMGGPVREWLARALPFNGVFVEYREGHYWRALWQWLTHGHAFPDGGVG